MLNKFKSSSRGDLPTTPWLRRTQNGVYFGRSNGNVWVYYEFPLAPLQWEDANRRLQVGQQIDSLLGELGASSLDIGDGIKMLSRNRAVHIFAATFDEALSAPEGTPDTLADFMDELLVATATGKALMIGVKLRSSAMTQLAKSFTRGGVLSTARSTMRANTEGGEAAFDAYKEDFDFVDSVMRRNECFPPRQIALDHLESWFNFGQGPDAPIAAAEKTLHVTGGGSFELAAVMDFDQTIMHAPESQWLLDAMTHPEGAVAVSVRGELTPPRVVENMLRGARRKLRAQDEEEAKTGDVGRDENSSKEDFARQAEGFVRSSQQAWLTKASVLMARFASDADSTYIDMLRTQYGIDAKPLENRQLNALAEMQPCAQIHNPFQQVINPAMISFAGLPAFSNIGDEVGVWLGMADPDYRPVYLHPFAAPMSNKPPIMGVFGDPGSGKTFACQVLAAQAAFAGVNVFMVNPKPMDSLVSYAEYIASWGIPVNVVSLSKLEEEGGAFDPFRILPDDPNMAAEILTRHIITVIGRGSGAMSGMQEIRLGDGLKKGAVAGARCAYDALQYVDDPEIRELVVAQASASTLFALGIGWKPAEPWAATEGFTLIEFDRELPLPARTKAAGEYERDELIALATMRLVTRASLELLMASGGGMLVVDEAHHYLSSQEGMASLQRIGREGRSMNLFPVFATQRVSDLLDADMGSYTSRVLAMKLIDPKEADAALRLCQLEPTPERIQFLRDAGPKRPRNGMPGRGALGFFRDLEDRHSVVMIGPIPEDIRMQFSTNPEDRRRRDEAKKAATAAREAERDAALARSKRGPAGSAPTVAAND